MSMRRTEATSLHAAMLASLLATACAAEPMAANALPPAAPDYAESPSRTIAAPLPEPPGTTPSPWREYAVEEAMGAKCPVPGKAWGLDSRDAEGAEDSVLGGACVGRIPAHVARFLASLGAVSHLRPGDLQDMLEGGDVRYRAMSGNGSRPDFLVEGNLVWVRTIEARDGAATYLVDAPFGCRQSPSPRPEDADCVSDVWETRAYRVTRGEPPEDITGRVFPKAKEFSATEHEHYLPYLVDDGGMDTTSVAPWLDYTRLQQVPTLRRIMQFDPDNSLPASDPRAFGDPPMAHFGFLVWNGTRYELRETVTRDAWPCVRVPDGVEPCSDARDVQDPFIEH
jgi:hypothetical protein